MPNTSSISSTAIPILPTTPAQYFNSAIPNYGSVEPPTLVVINERRSILTDSNFVCPVCHIGLLEREFTLLGFLFAILFFPFGLICLFILRKWRCSLCGSSQGY